VLSTLGQVRRFPRALRSCAVSAGLVSCSGALVHLSGGLIEMHFHFFVVVALLTLYQDWLPYLTAITLTVLEHGAVGVVDPTGVYNHHQAIEHPWRWALIHGGFVLAASAANVASWRVNETEAARLAADREAFYAQQMKALNDKALHDPLTGLGNRQLLLDRLSHALELARRHDSRLAVLFVDLDGFKRVNDDFGHHVGDELLKEVAARLRQRVRAQDTVARLGGDEFVIVCEDARDNADIDVLVTDLRTAVASPLTVPGTRYQVGVTAAIGVEYSDADSDPVDLVDRADLRMYADKNQRKSQLPRPRTDARTQR
jgi:diguanylate cyclase (GGDEF)-like protein